MQYMYLRRKGKSKNPGRHPIGMIGVQRMKDGNIAVGVLTLHSNDRFNKAEGRRLMFGKIYKDLPVTIPEGSVVRLTEILPAAVLNRLDNPVRHQEILGTLIQDEQRGRVLP